MKPEFTRRQWRIFFGCFLTYFSVYVSRLNLPAALNSLMSDMRLTGAQGGLLQTLFALMYAGGQFINGAIVDWVSARRHILLGLGASGLCNLLFGLAPRYWMLAALWALNGAAQSMIWTSIVKLMAAWFKGDQRRQVSFGISMTLITGNLCAWMLSGFVAANVSWRLSFIIPAVWAMLASAASFLILRDHPEPGEYLGEEKAARKSASSAGSEPLQKPAPAGSRMPFKTMLLTTGMAQVLMCCVGNGFVRDGVLTWTPTIVARMSAADSLLPILTSLIIPVLNLIGILLAHRVYAVFHCNARRCVSCLMIISSVSAFLLIPGSGSIGLCALLLGLCCSATYGINPMLTTFIPMEYEGARRVGLAAGLADSSIYLGAALTGVITGAVSDRTGWHMVFALWGTVAALSCAAGFISERGLSRL